MNRPASLASVSGAKPVQPEMRDRDLGFLGLRARGGGERGGGDGRSGACSCGVLSGSGSGGIATHCSRTARRAARRRSAHGDARTVPSLDAPADVSEAARRPASAAPRVRASAAEERSRSVSGDSLDSHHRDVEASGPGRRTRPARSRPRARRACIDRRPSSQRRRARAGGSRDRLGRRSRMSSSKSAWDPQGASRARRSPPARKTDLASGRSGPRARVCSAIQLARGTLIHGTAAFDPSFRGCDTAFVRLAHAGCQSAGRPGIVRHGHARSEPVADERGRALDVGREVAVGRHRRALPAQQARAPPRAAASCASGRRNSIPCAAASSSMREDVRGVRRSSAAGAARRRSPSRRGLPGWRAVGRLSTLAGWASDLFSLASAAAVTWAIMKPLLSPGSAERNGGRRETPASISIAMRRSAIAPTSAIATAIASAASATGSAWKLPPRDAVFAPLRRRTRAGCRSPRWPRARARSAAWRELVEAGADDLRLAAQAVRVLHPVVALQVRAADLAAGEQRRGSSAATSICPGWPRSAWMRGSNGRVAAARRVDRERADDERRLEHRLEREQRVQRERRSRPACR